MVGLRYWGGVGGGDTERMVKVFQTVVKRREKERNACYSSDWKKKEMFPPPRTHTHEKREGGPRDLTVTQIREKE